MCEKCHAARAMCALITEHGAFLLCQHHTGEMLSKLADSGTLHSILPMHTDAPSVSASPADGQTGEGQF